MAGIVTQEVLKEFMDRMHLDDDEDGNLLRMLKASNDDLLRVCGDYDIQTHEVFKELVFERSRYVYNDALEYFNTNFLTQINNLMLDKVLSEVDVDEGQ